MYRQKRDGVQGLINIFDDRWEWTSAFGGAVSTDINEVAPQIQNTVANENYAEMALDLGTQQRSLTARNRFAAGVVLINSQIGPDIYHYEVSGKATCEANVVNGLMLTPFVAFYDGTLVSNESIKTNVTQKFRILPSEGTSNIANAECSVNTSIMLNMESPNKETGYFIFGWLIANTNNTDAIICRPNLDMNVKKYVADLKTFDPSR